MTTLITLENPERTGAPWMALQYARALLAEGHRVVAACGPPAEGSASVIEDLEESGADVRRLPSFKPRSAATVLWRLRDLIRGEGVSCVLGFQQRDRSFACLSANVTGRRCVISAQNQHVFHGGALERRLKARLYGWALHRADLVICTSDVVQSEVRRQFGIGDDRTSVLPNGIDVGAFPTYEPEVARDARRDMGVGDDELLLLSVGRLDRQKGQDLLLEAFGELAHRYPCVRLAVAGSAGRAGETDAGRRYEEGLYARVREAGIERQVDFLGWRDDVPRLLAAADVYVQPSRWEGWPVAVVEAMAAGLPVVASDCAGRPQGFVDGEHGWIVPTEDTDALGDALERALATDRMELKRMGAGGRLLAEQHYDIRTLGGRFVDLVERVVAS